MPGIEITGFAEVADAVGKYKDALEKEVLDGLMQIGQQAFSDMESNTPVKTGFLKSRWNFQETGNGFNITNDCEYASFVEFGTSRMEGRNFITPPYESMRADIDALIRQYSTR